MATRREEGLKELKERGVKWGSEHGQSGRKNSHRQKEMERHNEKPCTPSWSKELRERGTGIKCCAC